MWGARILPEFSGKIQVITIITGVKSPYILGRSVGAGFNKAKAQNELGIEVLV